MPTDGGRLHVHLKHRVGALVLDVSFEVRAPWTVLFGPSGSGKTTVLRAIAGFLTPDAGRIVLEPALGRIQTLFDRSIAVQIPPHRRPMRMSGQRPQMFARRTVRENIGYGARGREEIITAAIEHLRLEDLSRAFVDRLSGGEQQRVAMARAIAAAHAAGSGTWLLLDEPFTGLDLSLRSELMGELRPWLEEQGLPVISVTHDVAEVFTLEADVVRLSEGRVTGTGPGKQVLAHDRLRLISELEA